MVRNISSGNEGLLHMCSEWASYTEINGTPREVLEQKEVGVQNYQKYLVFVCCPHCFSVLS